MPLDLQHTADLLTHGLNQFHFVPAEKNFFLDAPHLHNAFLPDLYVGCIVKELLMPLFVMELILNFLLRYFRVIAKWDSE